MRLPMLGAIAALAALLSCSSTDSKPSNDGNSPSVDDLPPHAIDFCATWSSRAGAWCQWQDDCCAGAQAPSEPLVESCDSRTEEVCLETLASLLLSDERFWNEGAAAQCMNANLGGTPPTICAGVPSDVAHNAGVSDYFFEYTQACRDVITGPKVAGDRCDNTPECGRGLTCRNGECASYVSTGSPCIADYECAEGNICVGLRTGGAGRCDTGEEGAACSQTSECNTGLRCDGGGPTLTGSCAARLNLGGACGHDSDCAAGLRCSEGLCVEAQAEGSICGQDVQ